MCIQIIQYTSILLASFPGQLNGAASDVLLSVRYSYNDSQYSWHIFALFRLHYGNFSEEDYQDF